MRLFFWNYQLIANASYRIDVLWCARYCFQLLSQVADMHHDSPDILFKSVCIPETVENLTAGEYPVGIFTKKNQHFEFFRGQMDRSAGNDCGVRRQIDLQITGSQQVSFFRIFVALCTAGNIAAPQVCFDAGYQFCRAERFCDIVIAPDGKPQDFVLCPCPDHGS